MENERIARLEERVSEIRDDVREMKSDLKGLLSLKWRLMGMAALIAFAVSFLAISAHAGYYPWGWQGWLQSVATITDAPSSGVLTGSVVFAQDNNELYYWNGSEWTELSGGGSGTVTSVSVASANGFAGTVANPTTTPAITMETTITGLLHGNGTAVAAETVSSPLNESSGTLSCQTASGSQPGCVTAAQVTQWNGAQPAGNYITALTGDGTASGPGSAALTLATVNSDVGSYSLADITVNAKGLVTAAAAGTSTDVISLFTGCSGTDYLGADGACHSASGALTFADSLVNTAGTVTLVNDSATPGASEYYGTNGSSTLGYYSLPAETPGGSSTDVQYNSSGSFGGDSGMTYDGSGDLTLSGKVNATTAVLSNLTASSPVFSDSSKNLTSSGTVGVANGGTGFASDTAYEILAGGTTSTAPFQQVGIGTSGQVLTSNGTGSLPSFQASAGGGVSSVTASAPIASSGGSTPNISLTGTVVVANGGTGDSSLSLDGILLGNGTSAVQVIAPGTTAYPLVANGPSSAPSYQQLSLSAGVTGTLPIANGGTANGSLGVTAGGVLYTDGTKIQNTGASTSGYVLISNGSSPPSFTAASGVATANVSSSGTGQYHTEYATIDISGAATASIINTSIPSLGISASGTEATVTFPSGEFSVAPACNITCNNSAADPLGLIIGTPTSTSLTFACFAGSVYQSSFVSMICMGPH